MESKKSEIVSLGNYLRGVKLLNIEKREEMYDILEKYNLLCYLQAAHIYIFDRGVENTQLDSHNSLLMKIERNLLQDIRYEITLLTLELNRNLNSKIEYTAEIPDKSGTYEIIRIIPSGSTFAMKLKESAGENISSKTKLIDIDTENKTLHLYGDTESEDMTFTRVMVLTIIGALQSQGKYTDYIITYNTHSIS